MTINVTERIGSPKITRGKDPQTTTLWKVHSDAGAITDAQAYNALLAGTPDIVDFLLRNQVDIESTESEALYYGSVTYKVDPIPSEDAPLRFKGSTRAGQAKVNRSLETVAQTSFDSTPIVDYGGAIAVNDKGEAEGTEIYVPQLEFSLEIYIPTDFFTDAYARRLYQYTPCTNLKKWGLFNIGECLYIGAEWSGSQGGEGEDLTQITYYFTGSADEVLAVPGMSDPAEVTKGGHQFVWYEWENYKDPLTGVVQRRVRQVNVERNYVARDFGDFGLGI